MKNRLSKVLAACGVASRRKAEELIDEGHVRVNSQTVTLPQTIVELGVDRIEVKGRLLKGEEGKIVYLLNKPKGYVCSNRAHADEKVVFDLFPPHERRRLFTVGRLDKESQGLLIITNDGHLAQSLIHPSKKVEKEYLVKTLQPIRNEQLKTIISGCFVEGVFVKPIRVTQVNHYAIKVTVHEGKKHEVRLLVQGARLKVELLKRIRIGGLTLGRLPVGIPRPIKKNELQKIIN